MSHKEVSLSHYLNIMSTEKESIATTTWFQSLAVTIKITNVYNAVENLFIKNAGNTNLIQLKFYVKCTRRKYHG